MRKSPAQLEPYYARRLVDLEIDAGGRRRRCDPHRVTATLERLDAAHQGQVETIKARYVVGCDGARSTVRKSHRARAARRLRQSRLGRDGCAGRHRFPRHPLQVADPVRATTAASSSSRARAAICFASMSSSTSSMSANGLPDRNITSDDLIAAARRILQALYARGEGGGLVVGLRDRPAAVRQVRRRARDEDRDTPAARVHRRRRLPHPQPESRPGHERLHAGRLQSRLEAGCGAAQALPAVACCTPTRPNARPSPRN